MAIGEPIAAYPEEHFQRAIVALVRHILETRERQFTILESFGLDIAVFVGDPSGTRVRFVEVKSYGAQRIGGVGFGNARGAGSQMALLLREATCMPLFADVVRWVYADATLPVGSARYSLFRCDEAKTAAMGGVSQGKQNNLRISALRDQLVDWSQLEVQLEQFVLNERTVAPRAT